MLNTLRESAHGIFAKILLGILVLSFGIWGIGDMFRNGGGAGSVASVGHTSISLQAYQAALRRKQEELRQMLGSSYKPELLRKFGIERQVLATLINTVLVDKETASLGIVVGDDDVAQSIKSNPAFAGKDGQFDKDIYLATLRSNNIAEPVYVEEKRKELAARLLSETIVAGVNVPDELVQALYRARGEQRTADILLLPANLLDLPEPTEKDLKDYYSAHSSGFFAPETRMLSYVGLTASDIQTKVDVPEDEIKRSYNERIQDFRRPERRVVEQMLFAKEADARAAADTIKHGKPFADVAKSAPLLNKNKLALGTLSKQDAPKEAADALFALKEGESTQPVESSFGWHIFHVSKIMPEDTAPLADVRQDIVKDLAGRDAQDTLYKLVNSLEDALAGGSTLENAAAKVGQKVSAIGPVTREGTSPDGKKLVLPGGASFLSVAFSTADKEHSAATQGNDGSYFLVRVDSVAPEHVRPLVEVKNDVATAWKAEKKEAQLKALAQSVATDLRAGRKPGDVLSAHKVTVKPVSSGVLKRGTEKFAEGPMAGKVLPRAMVLELFGLKDHGTTQAYPAADGSMMIATLTRIAPAPASDAKALGGIRDELRDQLGGEMVHDYLIYLTLKYGVKINEASLSVRDEEGGE